MDVFSDNSVDFLVQNLDFFSVVLLTFRFVLKNSVFLGYLEVLIHEFTCSDDDVTCLFEVCRVLQENPFLGIPLITSPYCLSLPFEVELHESRRLWPVLLVVLKLVSGHCGSHTGFYTSTG